MVTWLEFAMVMQIQQLFNLQWKVLKMGNTQLTVVADDTDILVMLLNMWSPFMADIVLRHEARKSIKKDLELISIEETASVLPE